MRNVRTSFVRFSIYRISREKAKMHALIHTVFAYGVQVCLSRTHERPLYSSESIRLEVLNI